MLPFVEWNRLLLAHFFPPAASNEEVWLHTTRAELDSFGLRLGGAEGLIAAVQAGPHWLSSYQDIADAASRLARQRKAGVRSPEYVDPGAVDETYSGVKAPTYLPYLALWVLASSDSESGFYACVQSLSMRPFSSASSSIREGMLAVWEDLAEWTRSCKNHFGMFAVRVLGNHRFVGIPRSQCLISAKDKTGLPRLFSECRLRPKQDFDDRTYRQVSSIAANAHYLSSGLRSAFGKPPYSEPLKHILTAALRFWDGKAPRYITSGSGAGHGQHGSAYVDDVPEVALVLRPSNSPDLDWDIHWRIPAFLDAGAFHLTAGEGRWDAAVEEAGTHASTVTATCQAEARHQLASAQDSDIEFKVTFADGCDESLSAVRRMVLPRRALRVLAWDVPDPTRGSELVEGEIPLYGPCYIFFENYKRNVLRRLLGSSQARWESFETTGLPEGWGLGCIHHCDLLTAHQRQQISENPEASEEIARVRLVGGRPLVRGSGRTYAFYDLPIIELEAPENARLVTQGIEATMLGGELPRWIDRRGARSHYIAPPAGSGVRRYALRIIDERVALFHIQVIVADETVAATTLKVSIAGGNGAAQGRGFGIGPFGYATVSGSKLQGVLRDEDGAAVPGRQATKFFDANVRNWKKLAGSSDLQCITESIAAKFLDSLAQLGSIAYGTARDQILRLAHQARAAIQPALLLLELRGRGYLEIETDNEGHMVRVHAVSPTLYTLPLQSDGHTLIGVCGTLRLQDWRDLLDRLQGDAWIEVAAHLGLPALRLVPNSDSEQSSSWAPSHFRQATLPCSAIAEWAEGLAEARATLGAWGWNGLATEIRHLQRFQATRAEFVAHDDNRLDVDPHVKASLFRFDDPVIQGLQVYVLGVTRLDGQRQFGFLHDSRWGIWLALSAFAAFAKRECQIGDAVPWPIHYMDDDGTLWLPARLRPPFVIERILLLCSATGPTPVIAAPGRISRAYADMTNGVWLAYRWVPEDIASKVAELLGATLAPLRQH